jgi:hypothetical protein
VALGQDLGADQDARAVAQRCQVLAERITPAGGLAVHAHQGGAGEARGQGLFKPFGAGALGLQRQAGAVGAGIGWRGARAAVVADEPASAGVHRHRGVAAPAVRAPAAVVADQHRCVTAPVLEHERLFATRQAGRHRIKQFARQAIGQGPLAHVQHAHARR